LSSYFLVWKKIVVIILTIAVFGLAAHSHNLKTQLDTVKEVKAAEILGAIKDVTLLRSVIKPVALNRVVRPFLKQAAGALCGMIEGGGLARWMANKPLILASQLASEQRAFDRAKHLLERAGYDVVVFKQRPGGGHPLESAIASGSAVGVLDLSVMEIAEDALGCGTGASKTRLEAAGRAGLPSVVAPGGIDSVSLKVPVPPKFRGRVLLESGPGQMLIRSTVAECREIGRILALKLNRHLGPVTVCLPLRGLSRLSSPGQPFHDPDADKALFESLESHLRKGIRVIRVKTTGEETPFLETCARALLMNLKRREKELPMLRSVEFLKEAPQLVLREAARLLQHLSFVSGEWVAPKHGIPHGLYFVLDGTIEVLENDNVVGRFRQKFSLGGKFVVIDSEEKIVCTLQGKWASYSSAARSSRTPPAQPFSPRAVRCRSTASPPAASKAVSSSPPST
jgi:uncharacterized protein (UPF0261 family)